MHDVVIIGGGFAGLSTAVELTARGLRALVVEARSQLGGRASAVADRATGECVDNGQHVLFGCYRETFRFLARIGAEGHVQLQPELQVTFIDRNGRRTRLMCPPAPPPLHLVGAVLEWEALPWLDRLEVLRILGPVRRARRYARGDQRALPASPGETAENWLTRNGQGPRLREMLWEPLARAALNQRPAVAAALPFARVLAELCGPERRDSAIGIPVRSLDRLYAEPAAEFITARGGEVRTNAPARVTLANGKVTGVAVRDAHLPARAVVVAVPWFSLSSLFAGAECPPSLAPILSAADRMASSPIVTVNLWFDRPVLDTPFIGLPGRNMQWVFDTRFALGAESSRLSLVSSGADALVARSSEELVAIACGELFEALPDAQGARLLRATAVREKRATFSLAPGQPPRPATVTPVRGLYLAGDWIDTGLPGTIESAVRSGHRAAEAVIASL